MELSVGLSGEMESVLWWAVWWSGICWCVRYPLSWRSSHPDVWWDHWRKERGQLKLTWSWWTVSGTVPRDTALEPEKPAVQPGNVKTVWLCQEIVLPGINYCFLITAFPLQLLLANLLYLGLHWWLIKFRSRWPYRAAGDVHLPARLGLPKLNRAPSTIYLGSR